MSQSLPFKALWKTGLVFGCLPFVYFLLLLGISFAFQNAAFSEAVIFPVKPLVYAIVDVSEDWNALTMVQILSKILGVTILVFGIYFVIGALLQVMWNKFCHEKT